MKSTKLLVIAAVSLFAAHAVQAADTKPTTDKEKFSYAIGFQIGQGFKRDSLDIDTKAMSQAIKDVLSNTDPQLSIAEMRGAMETAQKKLLAQRETKGNKAKTDGEAFLAENKKKDGVITLPSGLQYKVLKSGKGEQPKADSSITAHYKGALINGEEFDSSYSRNEPATFNVGQVIKGWQEILPLMHVGDHWQVVIPSGQAYGERGSGANIGPNETLVFEIDLLKIN
ncbi:MAG: FKBP-type peptidyl-prolyl cis-trans isomerase [Gammaproteobacteria bacterium]|nr:FKBP-type peptidyl-prolyl cis-trans isomerase [Gammaproteobacteria bacterium]